MKIRLQVLTAMTILGTLGVMGILSGYQEITGVCAAGVIGLGMKLLEGE